MAVYAVLYTYADGSDAARDTHRPAHRAFLQDLADQGIVLARGPWTDAGGPGALIVFRTGSAAEAEQLLDGDPFWTENLIVDRQVREWGLLGDPFAAS
jgi:uncharacterized protein